MLLQLSYILFLVPLTGLFSSCVLQPIEKSHDKGPAEHQSALLHPAPSSEERPITLEQHDAAKLLKDRVSTNKRIKENKLPHSVFKISEKDYIVFLGSSVDNVPGENEAGPIIAIYTEEIEKLGIHGEITFLYTSKNVSEKKIRSMKF